MSVFVSATTLVGSAVAEPPTRTLSLAECRVLALEKNLNFRVSRLGPARSEAGVSSALADFDPRFSASIGGTRTQQPNSLVYDPTTGKYISRSVPAQNSIRSSVGIAKDFAFGTNASLSVNNNWAKGSGSSTYGSNLSLNVTQPLLRNFGREVNESGIRLARNSLDISMSQLEASAISTVEQVEGAYWDLVNAIEGLKVAQLSLQVAQQLLERSRARAESGAQAVRDVLQAEAGVAAAQQEIISAQATIRDAEDNLKRLTDLTADPQGWQLTVVPVDTPHIQYQLPPTDTLVVIALRRSPSVYQARKTLEASELTLRIRSNGLLPSLYASTGVTLVDGDLTFGKSMDDIAKASYPSWSAGLQLSIPLGNRSAEASYRQAALDVRSAELKLESSRQQVYADVRAAVRRVETSRLQIAAAAETRRLQEANLENEQERLRLGLSTNYDVLQVEKDLAAARRSFLQARTEHEKALLALDRAAGRLLEARNIRIDEYRTTDVQGD